MPERIVEERPEQEMKVREEIDINQVLLWQIDRINRFNAVYFTNFSYINMLILDSLIETLESLVDPINDAVFEDEIKKTKESIKILKGNLFSEKGKTVDFYNTWYNVQQHKFKKILNLMDRKNLLYEETEEVWG